MARITVEAVSKGAQFPVAEMRGEEKHALARGTGALKVLEPFVDDQAVDVRAIKPGKESEIGEHPAEVLEKAEQRSPALAIRPIGEGHAQVEKPHSAEARPEKITPCRQDRAERPRQPVRNPSEKPQQGACAEILHSLAKRHGGRARSGSRTGCLRFQRAGYHGTRQSTPPPPLSENSAHMAVMVLEAAPQSARCGRLWRKKSRTAFSYSLFSDSLAKINWVCSWISICLGCGACW